MTGYVIFAHGSSVESANDAVRAVAARAAEAGNLNPCEAAFLEGGKPGLSEAVAAVASRGASDVVVIPYFLTLGLHLQRDLPELVRIAERRVPGVAIRVTAPLDGHPGLSAILVERAREASEVQ
jgi:sirohydrochlorin ferrochelatase